MTTEELKQEIQAMLVSVPSNPIHRQLVVEDYSDVEALEACPYEFREEFLAAVESGVWS